MSERDRGAYVPPNDDALSFDAREPRRRRPLPATLIASGAVLVVMIAAVFVFYRSGVRGAGEPPRIVGQRIDNLKVEAVEEARPVDESVGLDVYAAGKAAESAAAPRFAPPPEEPNPLPAQAAAAPSPAADPAAGAAPKATSDLAAPPLPAATVAAPAAATTRAPPPGSEKGPVSAALAPVRATAPSPAPPSPTLAAEKAPAKAVSEVGPAKLSGAAVVQIGAYASPELAEKEIAKVRIAFAAFTKGHGKRVEPVDKPGGPLYRTAFTGFSREEAHAFCAALKGAGRDCLVK